MKKIALQIRNNVYYPFAEEDLERTKEYQNNQVVRAEITGVKHPRSLKQIGGYFASCQTVANNNESPGWQTKLQVDFQCRVATRFYDPNLIIAQPNGNIAFNYWSISYDNLSHIKANRYFDGAYPILAAKIGTTVEDLLRNTGG